LRNDARGTLARDTTCASRRCRFLSPSPTRQRDPERAQELKLFREWKTAPTRRRREAALLELCHRSKPALGKALKSLAETCGRRQRKHITAREPDIVSGGDSTP
jgi:hypothetical protein